eukprot:6508462-Prymnesium_polylepis.2
MGCTCSRRLRNAGPTCWRAADAREQHVGGAPGPIWKPPSFRAPSFSNDDESSFTARTSHCIASERVMPM